MKLSRNQKGQALVELALVLPVLLLILFGIVEFGRIFHTYLVISNAAREGARKGVITNNDSDIVAAVERAANPSLDLDGLQTNITPSEAERGRGDPLRVEVSYKVDLFTPVITQILPDPFPLSDTVVMRIE
ncbi:TadE/TadG family type IV pilus assembly protein [Selenihalanaerobacter shriftii]|uniref:TadE-like protein n=1 Tax=Selenihalanaerobacter shriftii TaxID=142842 RepID=A0A1T4KQF9_9FIRM|nr:TadE family protein [Selenihalanaerobacter shriftii]SJZ44641.1 TadE-like protein [Selenihalanaerobacter shriftii]